MTLENLLGILKCEAIVTLKQGTYEFYMGQVIDAVEGSIDKSDLKAEVLRTTPRHFKAWGRDGLEIEIRA